jgi:hypothetical protein
MGAHRTSLPVVVGVIAILVVAACSPVTPTATNAPAAGDPTSRTVAVRLEGQVLDADRQQPIPGASVTTDSVLRASALTRVSLPASSVTDDSGRFVLNATLPADWSGVVLALARPGYESPSAVYMTPTSGAETLLMYPTVAIRSGQTIEVVVSLTNYVCGWESAVCRRLIVESPAGELIDVEVTPVNSAEKFGLVVGNQDPFVTGYDQRLVTLPGGDVQILGRGRVMVKASRH